MTKNLDSHKSNLTTDAGAPIGDNQNSMTAGNRGPVLIQDVALLEKLAHFNRERIPERVVHAKGAGAHGYFEVTNDLTEYTKADFLSEIGKKTPVFTRFSTVAGESGSADTLRDPRGFAVKLYTDEGNYDIVGNNTPIFFIRDAIKFPDFIHTQKRDPQTHLKNHNAIWDFWSLSPESLHQVTILMSDRGIPATFRHMHGFGSHTFKWTNAAGESVWVKYHFKTEQGIKNLTAEVAEELAGSNPDYHTEDLFNAIENGDAPAWKLCVQIMPLADADHYRFNPFDVTKVWSQKDYPLIEVGRMVLDRNTDNYFAEVEQVTFTPGNIVPGVDFSPDKLLQGRLFAYGDAHRHRVGANSHLLPINRPKNEVKNYHRDGAMRSDANGGSSVYYEPNSLGGPTETLANKQASFEVHGMADSVAYDDDDHYTQAGDLYRLLSEDGKTRLIANIVGHMQPVEDEAIKVRQIQHFLKADPEYGTRVAAGLGINI
ncbi:vegetative catalase [Carnobacterium maltaromaticum LMA28]|uniref:Catalase n=2 Tax=Carnobacterium maltaromaticum TaxID=2751 RepID=K8ELK0_CARML|nr:catalase [Carnobacterium maltaromaticum]AOA03163.1 catalase [Carnobacterium maltaromaticum]KRN69040.1 katA protein [Carnobacterium maltaromaticum DSM 20342]KRN72190.1 katA protein [Carnobacterium maltaromaticum]MBC9809337.1 catalase [Carnobacterium maltaromaticum]CAD5898746.1 vegetative catalase 1 [Carnobacterium maltaromaticum]